MASRSGGTPWSTTDALWFLDNGEGTTSFGPSLRGKGISTAPLSLVRTPLDLSAAGVVLQEVCGAPGGIVANPPAIDRSRRIVVGFDSGNGVLAAWRYGAVGEPLEQLWLHRQDHAGHLVVFPDTGEVGSGDFDHRGAESTTASSAIPSRATSWDECPRAARCRACCSRPRAGTATST
ncbi:MAG: hypothetical protein U5R31_17900 [Acidimicrobiia bacterium]|nr:hypothetical protein [Acidimicrobiia bacterium]